MEGSQPASAAYPRPDLLFRKIGRQCSARRGDRRDRTASRADRDTLLLVYTRPEFNA